MPYLSAAIVVLAIAIILSSRWLSRAISAAASTIAAARDTTWPQRVATPMSGPPVGVTALPHPPTDDSSDALLEIRKMAFDLPPLSTVGGTVSERMGEQDIVGISDGIAERADR